MAPRSPTWSPTRSKAAPRIPPPRQGRRVVPPAELFCADFDEGDVAKGWDGVAVGPGTMTTSDDAFVSPARSALVSLPATDAYLQAIKLVKTINGEFTSLRCSFAMRRDALGAAQVTFATLETRTTNGDIVTLYASANASDGAFTVRRYIAASDTAVTKAVAAPIAFSPGSWHEVRFEIDRTAGRIVVDGTPIATLTHDTVSTPLGATLALGGVEMDPTNAIPWKFRFDDVRCDRTP